MPEILKEIDQPALFWLDAHYSKGETTRGNIDTPIIQELESILNHHIKNHVILIDDARCFNGTNDYPKISFLTDFIREKAPHYSIEIKSDIVRIFLKKYHA